MIKYKFQKDFADAFERSLNEGEVTVNLSPVYTEEWIDVWHPQYHRWVTRFKGINWFVAGLTNINLRLFAWQTERYKTGLMKSDVVTLPAIVNMKAIPIRNIASFGKRQFEPSYEVKRVHKKAFRTDVGDVCAINVNYSSEVWDLASPYDELAALARNLEAALSGASLASQAVSTADAVSRLAALHAEGVLTDEEFARAKQGFVGATVEVGESATSTIRQLHSLYKSGVLTQSEFNMKKWDVLSRAA